MMQVTPVMQVTPCYGTSPFKSRTDFLKLCPCELLKIIRKEKEPVKLTRFGSLSMCYHLIYRLICSCLWLLVKLPCARSI